MALHYVLSEYMGQAMAQATYDELEDETFAGRIPACPGVLAFGTTMSECEQELRSTLEIRCPCSGALTSTGGRCVSRWTPRKRREFIRRLRLLGFDEPFVGTRHSFMVYRNRRQALPSNPGYSVPQLRTLLRDREVELLLGRTISAEEWNSF